MSNNNKSLWSAGIALAALLFVPELLGLPGRSALAETADGAWRWSITPYAWGSGIKTDVEFPSGQAISGEVAFDDLIDKLDIGAMIHVEGHREKWGALIDATYFSLSDEVTRGAIATDSELDMGMYEFAAVYTPGGAEGRFGVFAGARIIDLSLDMTFTGAGPIGTVVQRSGDASVTDFMVGARYVHPFSERWALNLRGDLGTGDSESSWNLFAAIGWRFGSELDNAVLFGWRHMELEIDEEGTQIDVAMDGPIAGVLFGF